MKEIKIFENDVLFKNGPCDNYNLLNQHKFYEMPGAETLNVKLIGSGLSVFNALHSPISEESLRSAGHTLVFGHHWYGWNDLGKIYEIAKPYIEKYNIKKLNIILQMHGIIKEGLYHLGLSYDPEGTMGSPKMLPASLIIDQISRLTYEVDSTELTSVSCYGTHLLDNPVKFKNTTCSFLSSDDVTWQADHTTNSKILDNFFMSCGLSVMAKNLLSYAANVKEKLHVPDIFITNEGIMTKIDFSNYLKELQKSITTNSFVQELIKAKIIREEEVTNIKLEELEFTDIAQQHPALFGTIVGACMFAHFTQAKENNNSNSVTTVSQISNDGSSAIALDDIYASDTQVELGGVDTVNIMELPL
ncbi:hypothetical protein [Candidatus Tisiphia endosymbiont of Micropterix aruncella]|uniref:hypothetical protein n=1 Tax=Candidatus Tisiphia endosymbiont of Micropterix aruncella TaxID=3066271 RepID=UPI003AA8D9EF